MCSHKSFARSVQFPFSVSEDRKFTNMVLKKPNLLDWSTGNSIKSNID